jgi:hypothetical protein
VSCCAFHSLFLFICTFIYFDERGFLADKKKSSGKMDGRFRKAVIMFSTTKATLTFAAMQEFLKKKTAQERAAGNKQTTAKQNPVIVNK